MMTLRQTPEPPSDAIIESARVLGAPRESVFDAFADPGRLARWWGPAGFRNVFDEFDFRPGGTWRFTMHGPDGSEYDMQKRFVEIRPFERIVIDHLEPPLHRFRMTMTFDDRGGGTGVTWRMQFESPDEARRVRQAVLAANEENFDRLAAELNPPSVTDP